VFECNIPRQRLMNHNVKCPGWKYNSPF
jgi:hypothetical protein